METWTRRAVPAILVALMVDSPAPPVYPTAEHVQKGPPDPAREPERAKAEKWCRVVVLVPAVKPTLDGGKVAEFQAKGPFSVPMAVRRKGTDLGSRDAWIFFTHSYGVFAKSAVFWNAPRTTKGFLDARLAEAAPQGWRLFDEVGAGFAADRVPSSYPAALGVFRGRTFAKGYEGAFARDLIRLELEVLECLRLMGLCLKTRSPINALAEIDKLLKNKPNVRLFTADALDDGDRAIIRQFGSLREGGTLTEVTSRFRVDEAHFTQYSEVKDGNGRQLVLDLIQEWQRFENEHGARVEQLGKEIGSCEVEARRLTLEIEREKDASSEESGLTRFLTRRKKVLERLTAERVAVLERKKQLEAEYDAIPGYDRVRGLSDRIEGFKKVVEGVQRLAINVFDHNVGQQQIKSLEEIASRLDKPDVEAQQAAFKAYDQRLRADVFPRILTAYAISGYVLRRPDSLAGTTSSLRNVQRINRMAADVIEYFRDARLGDKSFGEVFDETWGQVEALEARL